MLIINIAYRFDISLMYHRGVTNPINGGACPLLSTAFYVRCRNNQMSRIDYNVECVVNSPLEIRNQAIPVLGIAGMTNCDTG